MTDAPFFIVMRGRVPRIYPLWRPGDVWAPAGVGPRVEPEGDVS
jgi:hypothetical protein